MDIYVYAFTFTFTFMFNVLVIISQKLVIMLPAIINSTPGKKNAGTFGRDLATKFSINDPKK